MAPLSGSFERGMEQVAQSAKKTIKQQTTAISQAVKSQVVPQKSDVGTSEEGSASGQQMGGLPSDQTQAIEQAASNVAAKQKQQTGGQKQPSPFYQRQIAKGKTPEEAANLEKIRDELHKQYFEQLTKRQKPEIIVAQEAQKKQEMVSLEEEKEKKKLPPLPVVRKQRRVEVLPGSG